MNAPAPAIQTSELPLDRIVPSGTHIQMMRRERFATAQLADLAKSIREIGVLQPIVVRPDPHGRGGHFEIVAGERRWLAARMAGLGAVPATVRELTDEQVLKAQLVENLQREGLHELEEAEGYGELMQLEKITADQVAEMVGKSRSYVFARLKLLALGPEARKAFYTGEIDSSRALYIARIPNPKLQAKALKLATQQGWKGDKVYSVRQLREKLTGGEFSVSLKTAPFARDDASFFELVRVKKGLDEPRPLPACAGCPNRTGNCLDLFSQDEDPDVCMEPACHDTKLKQHGERLRQQVEAAGIAVLTGDEAKKIAPAKNELIGYVDLDALCEEDELQEDEPDPDDEDAWDAWEKRCDAYQPRTFRQLLEGTTVNQVVIEDPHDHRIRTLVPFAEAEKALKKQGIELESWNYGQRHHSLPAPVDPAERKRQEEEQRARQEADMKFRHAVLAAVFAKWSGPLKRDDLAELAAEALHDGDVHEIIAPLYGGKIPQPGQMKEADLPRLIIVARAAAYCTQWSRPQPLLDLARRLKIDSEKIKKELKAAAKAEAKPEKKATAKMSAKKR